MNLSDRDRRALVILGIALLVGGLMVFQFLAVLKRRSGQNRRRG
jgi:hypothetical protein